MSILTSEGILYIGEPFETPFGGKEAVIGYYLITLIHKVVLGNRHSYSGKKHVPGYQTESRLESQPCHSLACED